MIPLARSGMTASSLRTHRCVGVCGDIDECVGASAFGASFGLRGVSFVEFDQAIHCWRQGFHGYRYRPEPDTFILHARMHILTHTVNTQQKVGSLYACFVLLPPLTCPSARELHSSCSLVVLRPMLARPKAPKSSVGCSSACLVETWSCTDQCLSGQNCTP
eukprot:scaffold231252_cov23-Tisochrysis_lutea.AAC.1